MRRRRRIYDVDDNQQAIVDALRKIGASVQSLADVGSGCPDILAGFRGREFLLEIKNPKGKNRLTSDQENWHRAWNGAVHVVRSVEEAIEVVMRSPWNVAKDVKPQEGRVVIVGCKIEHEPTQVNLGHWLGNKWHGLSYVSHWMELPTL